MTEKALDELIEHSPKGIIVSYNTLNNGGSLYVYIGKTGNNQFVVSIQKSEYRIENIQLGERYVPNQQTIIVGVYDTIEKAYEVAKNLPIAYKILGDDKE